MATGIQATSTDINSQLTTLALTIRNWAAEVQRRFAYANKLGQSGLVGIGFSAADATDVLSKLSYLNTVAEVYLGTAAQPSAFSFDDMLTPLWAGQ